MHEFSLATGILKAARGELRSARGVKSCLLRVRVGQLSGVSPDSLRFCLEAAQEGEGGEGAAGPTMEIDIQCVAAKLVCPVCGEVDCTGRFDIICPRCGRTISGVVGGRELDVELEFDDDDQAEATSGED